VLGLLGEVERVLSNIMQLDKILNLSLKDYLRLLTIIGGYLLLRPVIIAIFNKGKKEPPSKEPVAEKDNYVHPMSTGNNATNAARQGWGRKQRQTKVQHLGVADGGAFDPKEDIDIREFLRDDDE